MNTLDKNLIRKSLICELQGLLLVVGFFILFKGLPDLIKISIDLKLGALEFLISFLCILFLFIPLYLPISSLFASILMRNKVALNADFANLHLIGVSLRQTFFKYHLIRLVFIFSLFSVYLLTSDAVLENLAKNVQSHLSEKFTTLYSPKKTHSILPMTFFYQEKTGLRKMKNANFYLSAQDPHIVLRSEKLKLKSQPGSLSFEFSKGKGAYVGTGQEFSFDEMKFDFALKNFVSSYFLDSSITGMLYFNLSKIFILSLIIHIFGALLFWLLVPTIKRSYLYCAAGLSGFAFTLNLMGIYSLNATSQKATLLFTCLTAISYFLLFKLYQNETRFSKDFN